MRVRAALGGLLGLGLMTAAPGPVRAEIGASGVLLCALGEAIDCDASGACSSGSPASVRLPGLVRLDFEEGTLSILGTERRGETTRLGSVSERDGAIVLQGFEARAFSVQIAKDSGALTAAVADEGYGFLVFGSCARP